MISPVSSCILSEEKMEDSCTTSNIQQNESERQNLPSNANSTETKKRRLVCIKILKYSVFE
jgi:hypothetical protein